ncbi:Oidioi.mRNA.OKI2018_I69.chr1.g2930.t1.cds [Oikopleura dioica]|uniref:Oidioi.mRNA.OKI2018_I69.chr1.g2930.t1.cds n=1 Tax=Oikopleura dioica TaxID=34765 RepID=A0ABN7SXX6_OIKDI|nr:Oidioi.mRNA.OKI2018_I69.chr1.g2930.t1.cds [Oikopleura dioica]
MARTWKEIKNTADFQNLLEDSHKRPQAVLITSPSCKACKRFKQKDFQPIVDQFPNTDWNEACAFESGIKEFSNPGILPKWNFFVDGKLEVEFPGVVWRNIDDAVCDCEWKKGIKRVIRMGQN